MLYLVVGLSGAEESFLNQHQRLWPILGVFNSLLRHGVLFFKQPHSASEARQKITCIFCCAFQGLWLVISKEILKPSLSRVVGFFNQLTRRAANGSAKRD